MKTLLTAGALLVASSTAFAGTYSVDSEFGTQGSVIDAKLDGLNETITVAGFDTSLGNLTGVQVTVFGQVDTAGSSTNESVEDGRASVSILISEDWKVTSSVGNYTFAGASFTPLLFGESSASGYDLETNEQFDFALSTGELSSMFTGNVSDFASGLAQTFTVTAGGITQFNNSIDGAAGTFENTYSTAAWGKVEVAYTYEEVASVPETGSLAIFGLGLAGFALSRKAKKSA